MDVLVPGGSFFCTSLTLRLTSSQIWGKSCFLNFFLILTVTSEKPAWEIDSTRHSCDSSWIAFSMCDPVPV